MLQPIKETLKNRSVRIVFPEGSDKRVLAAAARLAAEGLVTPVLLGKEEEIAAAYAQTVAPLSPLPSGVVLMDPAKYDGKDALLAAMVKLRAGKQTEEECAKALTQTNYFGTMLVQQKRAEGLVGGATYSTADTVRPALQLVKTKPGISLVSGGCVLFRTVNGEKQAFVMADCAINLDPNPKQLAEIALETAKTARIFGITPRLALLSYSTKGSGKGPEAEKMRQAAAELQALSPDFVFDGEVQFDTAVSKTVSALKAPGSPLAGNANVFLFPDLSAGNIGMKMAQRLGGFSMWGPILQGLNAPINDLSRGCTAEEIYETALITAAQAIKG